MMLELFGDCVYKISAFPEFDNIKTRTEAIRKVFKKCECELGTQTVYLGCQGWKYYFPNG